jgi:hypothetical protein
MLPRILGEHPLAQDANGRLKSRIATVCPFGNTIVTLPGIHATQRMAYVEMLSRQRLEPVHPICARWIGGFNCGLLGLISPFAEGV